MIYFRSHSQVVIDSSLVEDNEPFILRSHFDGCWWPEDANRQVFNSHCTCIISRNIPASALQG